MKVYIITEGSYSDYHICSVCLDWETVKKRLELLRLALQDPDVRVEEWDTDEQDLFRRDGYDDERFVRIDGKKLYSVSVYDNGEVKTGEMWMWKPHHETCWYSNEYKMWVAEVFGRNEKEAEKRAFDLVAQRKYGIMEERGDFDA